jgi:hypothetical protein
MVVVGAAGVEDVRRYLTERMPQNAGEFVAHGFNLSLPGFAHRLFGPTCPHSLWHGRVWAAPGVVGGVSAALQTAVLLAAAVRLWRHRTPDDLFAVLVPAMLLVCPLTWSHALPMLMIPVAVLASDGRGGVRRLVLSACAVAVYLPERVVVDGLLALFGEVNWAGGLLLSLPTFGTLGVLALAITRRVT